MKIRTNRVLVILIIVLMVSIYLDYKISKNVAIRYTEILTIHDQESFERVRGNIYDISPKDVREGIFSTDSYSLEDSSPILYRIKDVKLEELKGLSHYVFLNRFEVIGWKEVESLVYVKNRKVYDVHRKD